MAQSAVLPKLFAPYLYADGMGIAPRDVNGSNSVSFRNGDGDDNDEDNDDDDDGDNDDEDTTFVFDLDLD